MAYASSAICTCRASRSASEKTATFAMPASRQARRTRTAISPRLATSSFLIFIPAMILLIAERLHRGLDERRVDDVLERDGGLDEAVALPPRHLARDVLHPEAAAAVLVGQPQLDHPHRRGRVA